MAISKVVYGDETLMDISEDTVNENNLLRGATAHGADGELVQGAVITHNVIDNLTSDSSEDALSAKQGKELKRLIDEKESASTWSEVAEKPFSTIGSGLRVQNDVLQSTDLVGTKAEFDAIKDSLPDGSAFDTTDETVGGGQTQEIYDGEEKVIGTWFGKPLYRKCILINQQITGTGLNFNHNISNINTVTRIYGMATSGGSRIPLPYPHHAAEYVATILANNTQIVFRLGPSQKITDTSIYIEYTKTTD